MERAWLFSLLLWVAVLSAARVVQSVPYDYSSSSECLPEPLDAHYGGGIIRNSDFSAGLQDWSVFGYGAITEGTSATGNRFGVAVNRTRPYQSVSQKVYLQNDTHYTLSAWLQMSDGSADVIAVVKTNGDFIHAGGVDAKSGCWSILKGGLTATAAGPAELYFESNATVDIWVDSVSLQPFSQEEWSAHHDASIKQARKKTVRFRAKDSSGNPVPGAQVRIEQVRNGFPLGAAMSAEILSHPAYQRWFTSRFTVTTFENEMKWYSTERVQGREDYSVPDAMMRFAKSHGISVRGHNIFWDDPNSQPAWVKWLPGQQQLQRAAAKHMKSVMSRYAGQVIAWDVVNENVHYSFYESRLGAEASAAFYRRAHELDGVAHMFMNDYNTLEQPGDHNAIPNKYLGKLWQIKRFPGNGGNAARMAIGLEGHFTVPNMPYIRAALDTMSKANVPIWLTEIDVAPGPNQAQHLESILREVYAHPAVHGIILWTAWHPQGCYVMCLTDNNFNNLPTGNVVDKLIREWQTHSHAGLADAEGYYEAELFHGDYNVTVSHPVANSTVMQSLSVSKETSSDNDNVFTIHV